MAEHGQKVSAHEKGLAEFEAGGAGEQLVTLAKIHEEAAEPGRRRAEHERMTRHFHTIMALWSLLLKIVTRAE
jgi:hypothetical protein